jgi:hypothetical protein
METHVTILHTDNINTSRYPTYFPVILCFCSHKLRACHSVFYGLSDFASWYHKNRDNRKCVIEHKLCILIFSTPVIWINSHCKKKSEGYCNKGTLVFLQFIPYSSQISINLKFFRHFSNNQKTDLLKIQWKTSCSIRTDGQIDMTKLIAAFPSLAKTTKTGTRREALTCSIPSYPASMFP